MSSIHVEVFLNFLINLVQVPYPNSVSRLVLFSAAASWRSLIMGFQGWELGAHVGTNLSRYLGARVLFPMSQSTIEPYFASVVIVLL